MKYRAVGIAILIGTVLAPPGSFAQEKRYNLLTVEGRTHCQEDCMIAWCQRERRFHKKCDPYEPTQACQKHCICFGADCARR